MPSIRKKLAQFGDAVACHEAGRAYSYADLLKQIDQAATRLPEAKGQIVEVQTLSIIEGLASLLAILEHGHIAFPLPADLPNAEQKKMRQVAANSSLYTQLEGSGLILFSSGTSGEPKGMLHNFDTLIERYQNLRPRQDRCLQLLQLDHIGGLDTAFRCLFAGSTLVVPEARTPEAAAKAIALHRVNILPASPTFINLLLLSGAHKTRDLTSIEIIAYGAEVMPASLLQRTAEAFPKAQLQQKFGTSETGAIRIRSDGDNSLFFRITDTDTEWKIIDDELWLKIPSRIVGYLNAASASLEASGWYATGDLVESDSKGNLRIVGRKNTVINIGGQKVLPGEIEAALNELDGIEATRVFSKPDPITGASAACEIIVRAENAQDDWKRRIRRHCRGKLASWKIPTDVKVVDTIKPNRRMKQSS